MSRNQQREVLVQPVAQAAQEMIDESIEVIQGDCVRATAKKTRYLETIGASVCIGVAIVHDDSAILLHSEHARSDSRTCIRKFKRHISRIPKEARGKIHPLVFGGNLPEFYGDHSNDPMHEDSHRNRGEIKRILSNAGFGEPQIKWAKPDESHTVCIDLQTGDIELEVDSELEEDPKKRTYRCDVEID